MLCSSSISSILLLLSCNGHIGVVPRLKSRKSFMTCTEPIKTTAKATRLELCRERLEPWTPVCTLTSVLTNTSQLGQRSPEQPGGTQPVAYPGWPVKSQHVEVGFLQRTRNLLLWHQADHATSTGLPHDEHCLLSPIPDNG